ncbi:unnamed protein product [Rhizoctonia solani]|uniref:Xylanolytic transcriptional activator regulatory domain-containing protein n=1 Tax=Rhizoctonia solani TaxID=456999 RepID=A0A8H2WG16_9AGAM|nr:unnamed protein product [Rhizoctonia solani]
MFFNDFATTQKCDATKPRCNECVSASRNCQYEDETYRTRTQLLQDRIRELEAQILLIEEKRSTFSSTASEHSSDESSVRSSTSPGLSLGPSSSTSSRSASWTPITPTSPGSADDVFPAIVSPSSPSSTYSTLDIYPNYSKSTGPDPPPHVVSKLLDIFFRRHSQCGFELHLGRVARALQPDASEPLTPALLNSMLLMGCYFAHEQELKMWENDFFERTKWAIEENIALAHSGGDGKYNSLHHVQAMSIFGLYYYFKGRLLEGHVHTAHTTRLAVALGLHKLNSRIFCPDPVVPSKQPFGIQRWRPRDPVELGEAINLWWNCMDTELAGSTLNGLPPCVSLEDDVTTVWPRLLSDFESGRPIPNDDYSVNSLLDPETSSIVVSVSRDNVKSLIAKSYILMVWAAKLDIERVANHQGSEEWWTRFERCDQAINQFMMTMPPVRLSRNVEELAYLIIIHTAIYCSQLQLHNALAEFELAMGARQHPNGRNPDGSLGGISYARCTDACRATVLAAAIVVDIDLSYMIMFIGIAWVCVAEVLIREIPRLRRSGFAAQALEKEQQLAVIETCMDRLVATYPVLSLQLQQLQTIKAQQTFL